MHLFFSFLSPAVWELPPPPSPISLLYFSAVVVLLLMGNVRDAGALCGFRIKTGQCTHRPQYFPRDVYLRQGASQTTAGGGGWGDAVSFSMTTGVSFDCGGGLMIACSCSVFFFFFAFLFFSIPLPSLPHVSLACL